MVGGLLAFLLVSPMAAQDLTIGFGPVPVLSVGLETPGRMVRVRAAATAPFPQARGGGVTLLLQPTTLPAYGLIGVDTMWYRGWQGTWTEQIGRIGLGISTSIPCDLNASSRWAFRQFFEVAAIHRQRWGAVQQAWPQFDRAWSWAMGVQMQHSPRCEIQQ